MPGVRFLPRRTPILGKAGPQVLSAHVWGCVLCVARGVCGMYVWVFMYEVCCVYIYGACVTCVGVYGVWYICMGTVH